MIKYIRPLFTFLLAIFALGANAQSAFTISTTSSPYSAFGIGTLESQLLPQNMAMGGIATAINRISQYNNINPENPASYGAINYTTIDAGIYGGLDFLGQTGQTTAFNTAFRLSHVAFAIPVTKHSAFSFGLLPYSSMGYNYVVSRPNGFGTGSKVDTNAVNYLYNGNGGLSKAYLGYGFGIGKHLLIGANISYIFGNLQQFESIEVPNLYGFLNSRIENDNSVGGLNYDYGAQYSFDFGDSHQKHLILGYSASAKSSLNTQNTYIVSQYNYGSTGAENPALDTLVKQVSPNSKIQLPQINHFGISFQNDVKFLVGADYTVGKWSTLTVAGQNAGLQNEKIFNIGGEFTPDINALHNYFARTDYRLGFIYDDTYLSVDNTVIKKYAVTFGFGLPLAPNLTSFYKINFSAELGREGTLQNGLVKENYINLHLSFMINDRWFQRYKFE